MPRGRSQLSKAPNLVDLVQIWLVKSGFRFKWFIDRHFYGDPPEILAYLSSELNDLPIHKDFIALDGILPEGREGLGETGMKLLASDPKFFNKLASVMGILQSQHDRLSNVQKWFYAEEIKKVKRVISQ